VVPVNVREKNGNHLNLSQVDITKLIDASESEKLPEIENHTSDEIENESSDTDFDINNQQMNYKESIHSKNRAIKWKLNSLPHSSSSTANNIIKSTPGVTKYATGRVTDIEIAFEVIFNSTI
ncbi:hypothetical protein TNCT_387541, partial [Trichonephila clavata]